MILSQVQSGLSDLGMVQSDLSDLGRVGGVPPAHLRWNSHQGALISQGGPPSISSAPCDGLRSAVFAEAMSYSHQLLETIAKRSLAGTLYDLYYMCLVSK